MPRTQSDEHQPQSPSTSSEPTVAGDGQEGAARSRLLQRKIAQRVQRKSTDQSQDDGGPAQNASAETFTITDDDALIRDDKLAPTKDKIPPGTRVDVEETRTVSGRQYVRVKNHDTGAEIGWTSRSNAEDLGKKYGASSPTGVYHAGGHDVLVFAPPGVGQQSASVPVFLFFHGWGGNYAQDKTHAQTGGYDDNPAIAAQMAQAAAAAGKVAICPQAHLDGNKHTDWASIAAGGFREIVDSALAGLSKDLGLATALQPGEISIAGHSAGGGPLGQAAQDLADDGGGTSDVTLQEAGYRFPESWAKLRDWFLRPGKQPKTIRVITQGNAAGQATRTLTNQPAFDKNRNQTDGFFWKTAIEGYSKQLAAQKQIDGPMTVVEDTPNTDEGNLVLERVDHVLRSDGSLQGSVRLYHLADASGDHWAVSDRSMAGSMTAGADDRASDAQWSQSRG